MRLFSRKTFFLGIIFTVLVQAPFSHRASGAGATLYLSPASGSYQPGQNFTVAVRVDTGGQAINAGEAMLSYDPEVLEAVLISKVGSIFTIWTEEPQYSNHSGSLTFSGGLPSPGFNGSSGLLFTVTFRARGAGSSTIQFVSGVILANDGQGTNILSQSRSATYVAPTPAPTPRSTPIPTPSPEPPKPPESPVISSPTHPVDVLRAVQVGEWNARNAVEFNWSAAPDVTGFSYVFDHSTTTVPDTVLKGGITVASYQDVEDGTWYFHLRGANAGGWSDTAHYGIRVDATPPEPFAVEIVNGQDFTDSTPHVRFATKDLTSGISHYVLHLGGKEPRRIETADVSQAIALEPFERGVHAVQVSAYDRAGNVRDAFGEFTIHAIGPPIITAFPRTLADDEMLFLEGSAPPLSSVVLRMVDPKGASQALRTIASDTQGSWNFFGRPLKSPGDWKIAAHAENADGASSEEVEVIISVLATALHAGPYRITYVAAYSMGGMAIAVALVAVLAALAFSRRRIARLSQALLKEVSEAQEALRIGFQTLREDVLQELRNLDALQKIRPLTMEEQGRRERLLRDLAFIEFRITREVHDIEEVLHGHHMAASTPKGQPPRNAMPEAPPPA